jgi:hypothetical protein
MIHPKPLPNPRFAMRSQSRRPVGQPTRGKTASNRLRRVDTFLLKYDPALLRRRDVLFERAFFVDLGFGATPTTTLESYTRLRRVNPTLPVLGVEIDPERVTTALSFAASGLDFRLGGFNLPLGHWPDGIPESVRVVRAFNVLRQYEANAVAPAYARLAGNVLPGGLLIEGTSNPPGQLWVAHVMRRTHCAPDKPDAWRREALVFSTNFRQPFDPTLFQAVLPKDLIQRVIPGEKLYDFFIAWKQAAAISAGFRVWGARAWFVAAAWQLAQRGFRINLRPHWLRKGFLLWSFAAGDELL